MQNIFTYPPHLIHTPIQCTSDPRAEGHNEPFLKQHLVLLNLIRMFDSLSPLSLLMGGSTLLAAIATLAAYFFFFATSAQWEALYRWPVARVVCAGVDVGARHKAKQYFRVRRRTWIKPADTTADAAGASAARADGREKENPGTGEVGTVRMGGVRDELREKNGCFCLAGRRMGRRRRRRVGRGVTITQCVRGE